MKQTNKRNLSPYGHYLAAVGGHDCHLPDEHAALAESIGDKAATLLRVRQAAEDAARAGATAERIHFAISRGVGRVAAAGAAEVDATIVRGKAWEEIHEPLIPTGVSYDEGAVDILFESGVQFRVPVKLLQGLEGSTPQELRQVKLISGASVGWPKLDVYHGVEMLIAGVFGSREWMRELACNRKKRNQPNSSPDEILRHFRPSKTLGAKKYVEKRLLELIERGVIRIGDQIASAPKIAKQIGKSPKGVADGIAELRDWGIFETRGNRGTFCVRTTKLTKKIERPERPSRIALGIDDRY